MSERVKWTGSTSAWQRLFDLGADTGLYMFATPAAGDGRLRTAITAGGAGAEAQLKGSAALPADTWKTVTVTLDTGSDRLTMYSFRQNNFWELTVRVPLRRGRNTIRFSSEEEPNFDGTTYASDVWTEFPLRSKYAPLIDKIAIAPFAGQPSHRR